jgi:hypothetical protein
MQGLLDFVKTPEGQGLLSAVAGGLAGARRGTPLNNVGRGLLTGLQGYGNAQQLQQQEAESAMNRQVRDLQIKTAQQQMQEKEEQRKAFEGFNPQMLATQGALAGGGGPTMANASKLQPVDPVKQQLFGLARSGAIPIADYLKMTGPKETKVKDYQQVRNADGSVSIVGFTEDGRVVNTSQTPFVKPEVRDFGGTIGGIDPLTNKVITYGNKTMSPDAKASNDLGWANNKVARDRLKLDQEGYTFSAELGGYVPKAPGGQFRPLQGGPAAGEVKLTEGEGKGTLYLGQMRSATNQINKLTNEGKDAGPAAVAASGNIFTRPFSSQTAQQIAQAQNQWSEAFLRAKTGAAATAPEVELNNKTFFPQIGEGPEVIEQKRLARLQAEQDMEAVAGRGKNRIPAVVPIVNKGAELKGVPADIADILNRY